MLATALPTLIATLALVVAVMALRRPHQIVILNAEPEPPLGKLPDSQAVADLALPPFLRPRTDFDFLNAQPGRN